MSKWRPIATDCLYVIPDIHGAAGLLDQILKRILPLRKSDGIQDRIVFLGDYMDRGKDGHKVLDTLIGLKKKYKDNVIFLVGNHELMFFKALGWLGESSSFDMWFVNGGYATVVGYLERAGMDVDPQSMSPYRISDLIPKEHKQFLLNELEPYYRFGDFVFVHGGCEPTNIDRWESRKVWSVELNKMVPPHVYDFAWNRSLCKYVIDCIRDNVDVYWDQTIVAGHNVFLGKGRPIIHEKFLMLDCGAPKQLLIVELNSMEAMMARANKKRLLKYELNETIIVP